MQTPQNISVVVRAALICVACDIPAARKVCGFVSHNALLGCSKCLKPFPTTSFGEKPDYSGFDKINWTPRSSKLHSIVTMHICTKFVTPLRQRGKLNVIMVVGTQFYWNCLILMCVCVLLIKKWDEAKQQVVIATHLRGELLDLYLGLSEDKKEH